MNERNTQKELFITFQLKRIYSKLLFNVFIKKKKFEWKLLWLNMVEKSHLTHML